MKPIDITGVRKGKLLVIGRCGTMMSGRSYRLAWRCQCDCGGERIMHAAIITRSANLSCGCARRLLDQEITSDWLFSRCIPIPHSGCWAWMGAISAGYGHIRIGDHLYGAHEVSWQVHVGPIPNGLEIDHLCRVPCCINPEHLEPVTHSENVLRGKLSALKIDKTHCPAGHPYEGDNRYESGGKVFCRACNKVATAAYRQRKREGILA